MFLTVTRIHHVLLLKAQYQSLQNWHFGNISPYYEKDIPFRVILTLSREALLFLDLMANTKYIVCLSFPDPQPN